MRAVIFALLLSCCFPLLGQAEKSLQESHYKVGFIVSLTGPLAEFGTAITNGVTLAREEDPKVSSVFSPLYEDSRYDSKVAVSNFEKLRTVDKVSALYVFGGPMSETLAPMAERHSLPMFSTEYDIRHTRGRKFVVRFANNAKDYARTLWEILKERGHKKFSLIKVENQYHNTLSEAFIESVGKEGEAHVEYNVLPGADDFRAIVSKLRTHKFDALGVYLSPGMQNTFFKQLAPLNISYPLFGTDTFESRDENSGVEKAVEGALFANSAVSDDFLARYKKRFNSTSQIVHAALAYEFIRLLAAKLNYETKLTDPLEIIEKIASNEGRPSVCGLYFYRNSPQTGQYFSFPIAVREVRGGEARIIKVHPAP